MTFLAIRCLYVWEKLGTIVIKSPLILVYVMKKLTTLLSILFLSVGVSFANEKSAETYSYDATADFDQLNKIEKYVESSGATLEEMQASNSTLLKDLTLAPDSSAAFAVDELPLGIPAFWWGCVLTLLGVILVYVLTDKDKDQTKKALYGCLVTGGVYLLYIIFWGVVFGRATWLI